MVPELVQITRTANSTDGVRVSIFGRSKAELHIIERARRLTTTMPMVSRLAGACGLNFTSTLVRADASPMTLEEVQSA